MRHSRICENSTSRSRNGWPIGKEKSMTKHPLDAVELALVDASNALSDMRETNYDGLGRIDEAIDDVLRLIQARIRADLDPADPRD